MSRIILVTAQSVILQLGFWGRRWEIWEKHFRDSFSQIWSGSARRKPNVSAGVAFKWLVGGSNYGHGWVKFGLKRDLKSSARAYFDLTNRYLRGGVLKLEWFRVKTHSENLATRSRKVRKRVRESHEACSENGWEVASLPSIYESSIKKICSWILSSSQISWNWRILVNLQIAESTFPRILNELTQEYTRLAIK